MWMPWVSLGLEPGRGCVKVSGSQPETIKEFSHSIIVGVLSIVH